MFKVICKNPVIFWRRIVKAVSLIPGLLQIDSAAMLPMTPVIKDMYTLFILVNTEPVIFNIRNLRQFIADRWLINILNIQCAIGKPLHMINLQYDFCFIEIALGIHITDIFT